MAQSDSVAVPPRLPLVVLPSNRDSNLRKDARLVNCYIETNEQGEIQIYRRPGIRTFSTPAAATIGLGLFSWKATASSALKVYSIFNDTLYEDGVSVNSGITLLTTQKVYFNSMLGATPKMIFGDTQYAYTWYPANNISANLHSINVEFPEFRVPGFAYLNGATYVMQPEAVIWGSKPNSVDQVGDWDPLDFISAQADPDYGVFMSKQLVYVLAGNEGTTEVFFDAGNAVGSPLGPVQGSIINYGCASADSLQQIGDTNVWLAVEKKTNALQVVKVEQLGLTVVSTKAIDKLIYQADVDDILSWQVKFWGHSFYVISFPSLNLTLAYDLIEDLWSQWTDTYGDYLRFVDSTFDSENRRILQHKTAGTLSYISPEYYSDTDGLIPVSIYTPSFDAQTRRNKQNGALKFIADQVAGSVLQVRHSDDDYQSWSNFIDVDLSKEDPMITQMGSFRKRAYHFFHKGDQFFRMSAIETQYDIGTT